MQLSGQASAQGPAISACQRQQGVSRSIGRVYQRVGNRGNAEHCYHSCIVDCSGSVRVEGLDTPRPIYKLNCLSEILNTGYQDTPPSSPSSCTSKQLIRHLQHNNCARIWLYRSPLAMVSSGMTVCAIRTMHTICSRSHNLHLQHRIHPPLYGMIAPEVLHMLHDLVITRGPSQAECGQ